MDRQDRIERLVVPSLEAMGYELVRIQMQGRQRPTLQVMAERRDRRPMTVEDCADISRALSAILDVEDPIQGAYVLEVSSPGIDRPLVRPDDYARFAGFEARVETGQPVDGRKRFRGQLLGLDPAGNVRLAVETGEVSVPFAHIQRAKLVLTDALIAATTKGQEV
ncbi:MAG: ribosome maturation factor RimP [Rhodospirillales bacterium]|nr:ribosome maturation factor RimP [Rhodospirillales bacterium]